MRVADAMAVEMTIGQALFGFNNLALGARLSESDPIFVGTLRLVGSGLCFPGKAKIDDVSHVTNGAIKTGQSKHGRQRHLNRRTLHCSRS
jgi:hypothetical protein